MINEASKKDIFWGYSAQFLNIGAGVLIIPFAIKCLSTEDMGLWYLFIAIAGLANLLEFGFQPTVSRMTSYVYSGACELVSEGVPENGNKIDYQLLYDLIEASKKIYRYVAIGVASVLIGIGTLYLNTFSSFKIEQLIAWIIFSGATVINFYFTYFNGLLIGKGNQSHLYRITAISKFLMLLTSVPLLIYDFGLMSMAFGTLISSIFTRLFLYLYFNSSKNIDLKSLSEIRKVRSCQVRIVWLAAWKLGLTSLGSFLILRANQFIASSYFGLKIAASYGLTIQLITILSSVSSMYFTLNIPKLTALQSCRKKSAIIAIVTKSYIIVGFLYFLGCVAIVLIGIPIMSHLEVNTNLVSFNLLVVMFVMYGLELNHTVSATFLTTLNKVPFLFSSLASGIAIVVISLFITNFTSFDIIAIILGQLFVQAVFNNWYWPLQVWKELKFEK